MVQIDNILLSDALFEEHFCCDLHACKGACCVAGDAGAPLSREECEMLEKDFDKIKPFMQTAGVESVLKQGKYVRDVEYDISTPLINGKECVYTIFDENGIASCAIEKACFNKKTKFRKPISCFLYPIRVSIYPNVISVNYDEWHICKPALDKGKRDKIKVFEFLKEPICRRFGNEFYEKLEIYNRRLIEISQKNEK
jgi:hypothetical protein